MEEIKSIYSASMTVSGQISIEASAMLQSLEVFNLPSVWMRIERGKVKAARPIVVIDGKAYPCNGVEIEGKFPEFSDRTFSLRASPEECFILSRGRKIQVPASEPKLIHRKSGRPVYFYENEKVVSFTVVNNFAALF